MRSWLGPHQGELAKDNPVAALERGEIEVPHFEQQLAQRLSAATGREVPAAGLLQRMFDQFEHAPAMAALVLRARRAGLRTGLLSNSWGNTYPREGWDEMFDAIVISGEVGMRKPEPDIFAHVLARLGVSAAQTVFVDDLTHNVAGRGGARSHRRAPHVVRHDRRRARGPLRRPPPRLTCPPSPHSRRSARDLRRVARRVCTQRRECASGVRSGGSTSWRTAGSGRRRCSRPSAPPTGSGRSPPSGAAASSARGRGRGPRRGCGR